LDIFGQSDIDLECQIALTSDFESVPEILSVVRVAGGKGSTHDWTTRTKMDFRNMREKALSSNGAFDRMEDSVEGRGLRRGRACRAYLISTVLNIFNGKFRIAANRQVSFLRLTKYHFVFPNYWRGLFFQSHWHNVQKCEQEEFFRIHYPSEQSGFWHR